MVTAPGADVIRLGPGETAAALSDPATAEAGVWSALANLGIGVYTGSGEQVLGGSETSEDDFWLYDFEVPALVRMATSPPSPFAVTYSRVGEVGFAGSIDDLLALYRETYAAVPEAYLVQLFAASEIVFDGDLELTQFQEWLLMLDTFVPPNAGTGPEAAGTGLSGADEPVAVAAPLPAGGMLVEGRRAAYQGICGSIHYGMVFAGWGYARVPSGLSLVAIEAYYATHGLMLTSGVKATIEAKAGTAHEGHSAEGEPVDFVVTVSLEYFPQPVVDVPGCGVLLNMDVPFVGPLEAVEVEWQPDDVFEEHGRLTDPVSTTGSDGEATVTYVPREERSDGRGLEQDESGTLTGTFNMKRALMAFVIEPRILALVPERMPINDEAELEVVWHQANIRVSVFEIEGTAVMEYEAWTCDGERWDASFEWTGNPGGAVIDVFADFEFELPEGGKAINPVDAVGGITAADVTFSMTIPYNFEFTLEAGDPFAVVGINRQPGGGVTGPFGGEIPFPASSFPEFDFVAPLEENFDCPD